MAGIDTIIEDTTDWTASAPASVNQGEQQTRQMERRNQERQIVRGNQRRAARQNQTPPVRASVGGQTIEIPKERLRFWLEVGQLVVLVLILLRQ